MSRNLKETLSSRVKKEIISDKVLDFSNEIYLNNQYGEFLKQKTFEFTLINVKGSLAIGKLLEEVYQTLGKKGEGIYIEWLNSNNINRITAWRHRKRYNLFSKANDKAKEIVALLTVKELETFFNNEEKNLEVLNSNKFNLKEFKNYLIETTQQTLDYTETEKKEEDLFSASFIKKFSKKFNKLDEDKKERIENLLKQIEEILIKN